jgi:hypothetical protein
MFYYGAEFVTQFTDLLISFLGPSEVCVLLYLSVSWDKNTIYLLGCQEEDTSVFLSMLVFLTLL